MSSQFNEEQSTPSWRVNLTQKFNSLSKRKPQTKRQQVISFEDQLQQQLNFIPFQREQLSSNKKIRLSGHQNVPSIRKEQQISQGKFSRVKETQNKSKHKDKALEAKQQVKLEKLNFDGLERRGEYSNSSQLSSGFFSLFTDSKVGKLFFNYFHQRSSIQLKQFIEVCLIQFFRDQTLSAEIKSLLIDECRPLFCTTDQNLISLNAVELLTKKTQLRLIIAERILNVKYNIRKENLEKEYEGILMEIINQQEAIKNEQQKLTKKRIKIETHEKQILKKEKSMKIQEKQLVEKQKQMRKTLEQKSNKLLENLTQQFEKHSKEIEKKATAFERNARNKMELIQKRVNDSNKNLHHSQQNVAQKDNNEEVLSKKHNNEVHLLKNKLRKTEKEYENFMISKSKEVQALQSESTSLLKVNTMLESKLQKSKSKVKQLSQILAKISMELEETKRQLQLKTQRVEKLESDMLQLEHYQAKNTNPLIPQSTKLESKKVKQYSFRQERKQNKASEPIQSTIKQCQNCQYLVTKINSIFSLIIRGFENHSKDCLKQGINTAIKLQQVLINQSETILLQSAQILWRSMQYQAIEVASIVEFMLKLFLAKFSFLKFHSINDGTYQNNLNSIQQFVEKLSSSSLDKGQDRSLEQKLKVCSVFLVNYERNESSENICSFYLILSVLGIDGIFNLKSNKLEYVIRKISRLLLNELESQQSTLSKSVKVIKKFEDEQLMTYLFWKYLSFSTALGEVSIFIDILVELCNFYSLQAEITTPNPLFKSLFALQNYSHLFNFLLMNFTEKNLNGSNEELRQIFEKISIILQRFCYVYKEKLQIDQTDIKRLKKLLKDIHKNKTLEDSLFKANMESVLETISQHNE